jgi:hypothetical protein
MVPKIQASSRVPPDFLPHSRPSRLTHNQAAVELMVMSDMCGIDCQPMQSIGRHIAEVAPVNRNCGKRRLGDRSKKDVVETDQRDLLWHPFLQCV